MTLCHLRFVAKLEAMPEGLEQDVASPKAVLHEGMLMKRTGRDEWKKRWVRLYRNGPLLYFESKEAEDAAGVVWLEHSKLFKEVKRNGFLQPLDFNIRSTDGVDVSFRAESESDKKEWLSALKVSVDECSIDCTQKTISSLKKREEGNKNKRSRMLKSSGSRFLSREDVIRITRDSDDEEDPVDHGKEEESDDSEKEEQRGQKIIPMEEEEQLKEQDSQEDEPKKKKDKKKTKEKEQVKESKKKKKSKQEDRDIELEELEKTLS